MIYMVTFFFKLDCNSMMNSYTVNYYKSSNYILYVRTSQLGIHKWIVACCDMSLSSVLRTSSWHLAMSNPTQAPHCVLGKLVKSPEHSAQVLTQPLLFHDDMLCPQTLQMEIDAYLPSWLQISSCSQRTRPCGLLGDCALVPCAQEHGVCQRPPAQLRVCEQTDSSTNFAFIYLGFFYQFVSGLSFLQFLSQLQVTILRICV